MIARDSLSEKAFGSRAVPISTAPTQAMLGGLQWRHSVPRSTPIQLDSVGRPQQSHLAGRTQLSRLPARAGCTALSVWLLLR
jgi:hypothetical protein